MGNSTVSDVTTAGYLGGEAQYSYIIDTDNSYFLPRVIKAVSYVAVLDFTTQISCSCNVSYCGIAQVL